MTVYVPYTESGERVFGWMTSFDSAESARYVSYPEDNNIVEFPEMPADGFPKWLNADE